jgi:hypothetical protein
VDVGKLAEVGSRRPQGPEAVLFYAPAEEEPVCARVLAELEAVFGRYQDLGTVTVLYDTRL